MLVRFNHIGGHGHQRQPKDDNYLKMADDPNLKRQRKMKHDPAELGKVTHGESRLVAREQELRWLELSNRKK